MSTEMMKPGLKLLFVGFNPSPKSAETGHNYAGPNNRFYRILHESGLVDTLLQPSESRILFRDYNFGFTNLVARPTPRASDLSTDEYREGAKRLLTTLQVYQPQFACFVGSGVYQHFARLAAVEKTRNWGFIRHHLEDVTTNFFVAPATSGLVRMKLAEQVTIYRQLANAVNG